MMEEEEEEEDGQMNKWMNECQKRTSKNEVERGEGERRNERQWYYICKSR